MRRTGPSLTTFIAALVISVASPSCTEDELPEAYPDHGPPPPDGVVAFLARCVTDADCASNRCVSIGESRVCSRLCDETHPCPELEGWRCGAGGACECTPTGAQPDVCNVDGDCDGAPDRPPRAETCNGEDDDCNGDIDDVSAGTPGATAYYRDADGDGYGAVGQSRWLCGPEDGWVTSSGDCDDGDSEVHPDHVEVCGGIADDDCDGATDDPDVCGRTPIVVNDVNGPGTSASLKSCTASSAVPATLDVTEVVAKQDASFIKFTVRLEGPPELDSCAAYTLRFGDPASGDIAVVYVYRPAAATCGALAGTEAFLTGQPMTSSVVTAFSAADPGHVSFVVEKMELFEHLPTPTYLLQACTNAVADPQQDITACTTDTCELRVHR
jgi:hypothetical protein